MGGLCEGRGFGRFEVGEGEGCEAVQVGGCCWIGRQWARRRFESVEVGSEEFVERVRHFWRQDYILVFEFEVHDNAKTEMYDIVVWWVKPKSL